MNDGYKLAEINYSNEEDQLDFEFKDFMDPKKEVFEKTKQHTLRSIFSKACTLNGRLYIMHNLAPKDNTLPESAIKTPVRIMDFKMKRIFAVEYLNADSTGNKRGEEKEVKEPILPQTIRINYSIATHKNKIFIYGGLNEKNEVLNSMETFEA